MTIALLRSSLIRAAAEALVDKAAKNSEYCVMDTTIATVFMTICAATLGVLSPEATEATLLLTLPLMGATLVTGGAVMLNPQVETRKITMGRGLFGFLIGVPGPWALLSLLKYWSLLSLSEFLKLPPLLFLTGAAMCFLAFIVSWPFTRKMYEQSESFAGEGVRRLERAAGIKDKPEEKP